jgi:hypothetical protein
MIKIRDYWLVRYLLVYWMKIISSVDWWVNSVHRTINSVHWKMIYFAGLEYVRMKIGRLIGEKNTPTGFILGANRRFVKISYERNGNMCHLYVPYSSSLISKQTGIKVILLKRDINGEINEEDITQQPGIPYFVTPAMLGGISAKIIRHGKEIGNISADQMITIMNH